MTDFGARVEELRSLLGLTQRQFCLRIGLRSRSTFSNWVSGLQRADRDTAESIADRWHISLDSLFGRPGTIGLEPSPALRNAQEELVCRLADRGVVSGTPTTRLQLCYEILTGTGSSSDRPVFPALTPEVWSEWLRWTPEDWESANQGHVDAGPHQISGAAFLLGWYEGRHAWSMWIATGDPAWLQPSVDQINRSLWSMASKAGLDIVDIRRLIRQATRD